MNAAVVWPDAACGALYEATKRGDGLTVVGLLHRFGVVGPLQLIGDGLLVALAERPADAQPLTAQVLLLLEARGWEGDEVLKQALCGTADPALRRVALDLAELSALLDAEPEKGEVRVDLVSGDVGLVEWTDDCATQRDVLWLTPGSLGGWGDTARFAQSVPEGEMRDALLEALAASEHAMGRFHAVLKAYPGLERAWAASRSERLLGRARDWLMSEGVLALPRRQ